MMSTTDNDLTLYFRKKHTPPPSVLLLSLPADVPTTGTGGGGGDGGGGGRRHASPVHELRSRHHQTRRTTPHMVGLHVKEVDVHDANASTHGWQRHNNKASIVSPAPDIVYKNTYLEDIKREKSAPISTTTNLHSRSSSPRSQHSQQQQQQQQQQLPRVSTAGLSSSKKTNPLHPQKRSPQWQHSQYRTIYDYIRDSIRQMERQRNSKQHNFATRIQRPQNEDIVLRRALGDKKSTAGTAVSRTSMSTGTTLSTLFNNELRSPQSFVNYINHSREQVRVLHTTTPHRTYQQDEYSRQRSVISHHGDAHEQQQQSRPRIMMTAGAGNS